MVVGLLVGACTTPEQPTTAVSQTQPPNTADIPPSSTSTPAPSKEAQPSMTPSQSQTALDLKEANVLEVSVEDLGGGRYRFNVTLLHDDDGEAPSFADWWQVEDLDGNVLGKRILAHSHGTVPFTRSAQIEIPTNITEVLIRGHDMEHDFGGQSMRFDLRTGEASHYLEDG